MSLRAPYVAYSRRGRLIALAVLVGLALAGVFYIHAGYPRVEDVLPGATELFVEVPQPERLVSRLAATATAKELAAMPDNVELREFLAGWSTLAQGDPTVVKALSAVRSVTLAEWVDDRTSGPPQRRLVACVDAGVLGRVAKDAARLGLYDIRAKSDGGVEFARDLILTGSPADVAAAKALFARNDALAKRPEAERLQRAREAADPKADAVVYFVKDSIFRAPVYGANFDPRVFLNAGAIRYAFAEIAFQAERVAMRLVLEPLSGKRVTAVSPAPAGSFVTRALAGGESAVYLAWRPDRAAELSPLLLGRFGADDMKEYQKKLALLMLNTFFDCAGHEFAVSVPRGGSTDSPALVFQLAKKTEMIDLLSKLSKTAQAEAAALGAAIGPNGATLDDVLEALKTDAGLAKLTALANDEQRAKLQDAARRVRRGDLDPKTLLRSAERVYMFGRYWHWRVAGDLLVLSASPEQAEYVVERLGKAGAPAPSGVPADGVALANVDLATLLREWLRDQPAIAEWLRDHPATVTLGAKEEGGRLTASGTLMSDRPAGAP